MLYETQIAKLHITVLEFNKLYRLWNAFTDSTICQCYWIEGSFSSMSLFLSIDCKPKKGMKIFKNVFHIIQGIFNITNYPQEYAKLFLFVFYYIPLSNVIRHSLQTSLHVI